jgi:hypothetical protein
MSGGEGISDLIGVEAIRSARFWLDRQGLLRLGHFGYRMEYRGVEVRKQTGVQRAE